MKIMAIMQNQWLDKAEQRQRTNERIREEKGEEYYFKLRDRQIAYALFAGCLSGKILKQHLGDLVDEISWQEASPVIGSKASDNFPPDIHHIGSTIARIVPDVVITFGRNASDGVRIAIISGGLLPHTFQVIESPHPAARHPEDRAKVKEACRKLKALCIP